MAQPQSPSAGLSWFLRLKHHLLIRALTYLRTMSPSEIILFRYWSAPMAGDAAGGELHATHCRGLTLGPSTQSSSSWAVLNR